MMTASSCNNGYIRPSVALTFLFCSHTVTWGYIARMETDGRVGFHPFVRLEWRGEGNGLRAPAGAA